MQTDFVTYCWRRSDILPVLVLQYIVLMLLLLKRYSSLYYAYSNHGLRFYRCTTVLILPLNRDEKCWKKGKGGWHARVAIFSCDEIFFASAPNKIAFRFFYHTTTRSKLSTSWLHLFKFEPNFRSEGRKERTCRRFRHIQRIALTVR